jgi:FMNH2-dependent dimethyl sulfone monooxygenase
MSEIRMSLSPRKLRRRDDTMRFGIFWPYSRTLIPSETIAKSNPDVLDLHNHIRLAQQSEQAGLDFALIADGYAPASEENSRIGFQDPSTNAVVLAVPLMMSTSRLGIISTMHTKFLHPVVIARLGAHLDWVSNGRWGWNVVNGFRPHEARLFGVDGKIDHDDGYELADESMRIVKAIWDIEGREVHHEGRFFKVEGKIRRPVPPTTPLLVSAASSARGRAFATAHCDYLFATPLDAKDALEIQADLNLQAATLGKTAPPQILILCDLFLRDQPGRASDEYEALMGSTDPAAQKVWSSQLNKIAHAGRKGGDLMTFLGTPAEVAEQIVALRRESGVAGLAFRLPLWGGDEAVRIGPMLEILRKAGVWTPPAEREYSW